jgi:excisionase family DNA binding protein
MANAPLYLYDNPDEYLSLDDAPTEPWSGESVDPKSLAPVLKVPEMAKLLRVNRKTLYEMVRKNELPGARRVGHVIRIDRDAVLEWFKGQGRVSRRHE